MLDVSLQNVSNFALRDVSLTFPASTHTLIVGPPASGASTLLQVIAGTLKVTSGQVRFGERVANNLRASQRPLLFVTATIDAPQRWSVRHVLVAAVRHRTLDRVDRQREFELSADKWELRELLGRSIRTLSDSQRTLVNLARIELLRPGILVADRLLANLNPSAADVAIDKFYRTLRVSGTTVIAAPATRTELGAVDRIVVLSDGRVVQEGSAAHIFQHPSDEASAIATGGINVVPVTIDGSSVDSVIGRWEIATPRFRGTGVALVRPDAFTVAERGEESDLIVAVEEASFDSGRWLVTAILTGGVTLRISLPATLAVHKGKLLALRYDASRFVLIPRDIEPPKSSIPTDAVPPRSASR